jgi:hypothetical protein
MELDWPHFGRKMQLRRTIEWNPQSKGKEELTENNIRESISCWEGMGRNYTTQQELCAMATLC